MPRQDSLYEQLLDVQKQAVAMGCYDAADFLSRQIQTMEARGRAGKTKQRQNGEIVRSEPAPEI